MSAANISAVISSGMSSSVKDTTPGEQKQHKTHNSNVKTALQIRKIYKQQ